MLRWRITQLALIVSLVLTAAGCFYRVENYGYSREFGIGKIGCDVAGTKRSPKSTVRVPEALPWEQIVAVTPVPVETAADADAQRSAAPTPVVPPAPNEPVAGTAPPRDAAEPMIGQNATGFKLSDIPARITSFVPMPSPPSFSLPRLKNDAPTIPKEGWVGLPKF